MKKIICQTCMAIWESEPDNDNLYFLDTVLCGQCSTYSLMTLEEWTREKNKEEGTNIKPEQVEKYINELAGNLNKDFNDEEPTVEKYIKRYGEEFREFIEWILEAESYQEAELTPIQTDLYVENCFANATYDPVLQMGWDGQKYFKRGK